MPRVVAAGLALALIALLLTPPTAPGRAGTATMQDRPLAEPLLQMTLETLPAAPIRVQLFRMTLAPGAVVPLHSRPGPELDRIESGSIGVVVQGTPQVERASGDAPEAQASPEAGAEFPLNPGDEILFPPQSSRTLRNLGDTPAALVGVLLLPVGHQRPPYIAWAGGQPTQEALQGVNSQLLGDGRMDELAEGVRNVVVERLALAPGVAVPAHEGPVMLSVELGDLAFTLVSGEVQVATAEQPGEPRAYLREGTLINLGVHDAAFFVAGSGEIPRSPEAGVAVLLRLSLAVTDEPTTPATEPPTGDATAPPASDATAPPVEPEPTAAPSDAAPIEPGAIVVVTEDAVRLRAEPSESAGEVAVLQRDQRLRVTGAAVEAEGLIWWPVQSPDDLQIVGYVTEDYLDVAPEE